MVGRYFSFISCQPERISSRNFIHVNTEPKTRPCNPLKSMSLICQNAEDNAYVMIEICFRFDKFFQARFDWQIRDEVKVHLAQ